MELTRFGRPMESWEYCAGDLIGKMGLHPDSPQAIMIWSLPTDHIKQLTAQLDPEEDDLIHIDEEQFSINHGSVGSRGIRYSFY